MPQLLMTAKHGSQGPSTCRPDTRQNDMKAIVLHYKWLVLSGYIVKSPDVCCSNHVLAVFVRCSQVCMLASQRPRPAEYFFKTSFSAHYCLLGGVSYPRYPLVDMRLAVAAAVSHTHLVMTTSYAMPCTKQLDRTRANTLPLYLNAMGDARWEIQPQRAHPVDMPRYAFNALLQSLLLPSPHIPTASPAILSNLCAEQATAQAQQSACDVKVQTSCKCQGSVRATRGTMHSVVAVACMQIIYIPY